MLAAVNTWMGEHLCTGKPCLYVTSQLGQLSLPSLWDRLIEYRLGGVHSLVSVAGNTAWSHMACDIPWLWGVYHKELYHSTSSAWLRCCMKSSYINLLLALTLTYQQNMVNTAALIKQKKKNDLLIKRLVMLKERLERLQHFHLTWHPRRRRRLSLDNGHPQRSFMASHEALEVFQQQLQQHQCHRQCVPPNQAHCNCLQFLGRGGKNALQQLSILF